MEKEENSSSESPLSLARAPSTGVLSGHKREEEDGVIDDVGGGRRRTVLGRGVWGDDDGRGGTKGGSESGVGALGGGGRVNGDCALGDG